MAVELEGRIEEIVDHGRDTRSLFFRLPVALSFVPGQFVSCLVPAGGTILNRPYSIASSPEEPERIELLLNLVPGGPGPHYLFGLRVGATVRMTGPWGTFVLERAPEAETVFIAERTAIAPIRPMLRRAAATSRHPLCLLYATEHVLYRDELTSRREVTFVQVSPAALADEVARRWIEADMDRSRHFFVCGVGEIVPRLRGLLRGAGYERRAVHYEKW
jgi:ferredoxin-NADP reductase